MLFSNATDFTEIEFEGHKSFISLLSHSFLFMSTLTTIDSCFLASEYLRTMLAAPQQSNFSLPPLVPGQDFLTKTSISLFQRVTLKNHASGEEKILFLNSAQEKDKTHFMDQETGVEMELEDNMPLLEWLANNYKNFGAALEIITDRSQEGSQYVRGFGGIGGMLRYTVDFQVID